MAMSVTTWCSTTNPQGNCAPTAGVCKPMDAGTLALYKELQNQLNRVLVAAGKPTLGVDGRIGSKTLQAIRDTVGVHGVALAFTSCDQAAGIADVLVSALKAAGDKRGVPAVVAAPKPPAPPSQPAAGGGVAHPSSLAIHAGGFMDFVTSPLGLATIAGSGVALYFIFGRKRSRGRRSTGN